MVALSSLLDIVFIGKSVSFQIPAEITFQLDLSKINSDNIYIRKSKEDLEGFKVNKSQKEFTAVYAYPGYYKAQLIVDNKLERVNDVFVKSYGWVATLENDNTIEYLSKKDLVCDAMIGLSEEKLNKVRNSTIAPTLTYHYFDQLNPVSGLDFVFETRLKNNFNSSAAPCQNVTIEIVGTNSSFSVPMSMNACTIDQPLVIAGQEYYSTQVALNNLRANLKEWQTFKLQVNGGLAMFFLNDEMQLQLPVLSSMGQIVGFRFRFEGSGEVDFLRLTDTRDIIYAAPF